MNESDFSKSLLLKKTRNLVNLIERKKISIDDFFNKGIEELSYSLEKYDVSIFNNNDFNSRDCRFSEIRYYVSLNYPDYDLSNVDKKYDNLIENHQLKVDLKIFRKNSENYTRV